MGIRNLVAAQFQCLLVQSTLAQFCTKRAWIFQRIFFKYDPGNFCFYHIIRNFQFLTQLFYRIQMKIRIT